MDGSMRAIYTPEGRKKFEPLDSDIQSFRVIVKGRGLDEVIERDPAMSLREQKTQISHYMHYYGGK